MRVNYFIILIFFLIPIFSFATDESYVHTSEIFKNHYENPLKAIRQKVEEFNKTHVNRVAHVVINYNQTELSAADIIEHLEKDDKTMFEGINLDEADTVDILFFTSRTYFQLNEEDSLILLKDYYFNPISTHPATLPDPHRILNENQDLGLVTYIRSYLEAFGGAVEINMDLPSFDPITITSYDKIPVSKGVDKTGSCSFEIKDGGINLQLMNGEERLASMDIPSGVDISYVTNCTENKILEAHFTLLKGSSYITINSYRVKVDAFELALNEENEISGTISLSIQLEKDLHLTDLIRVGKGLHAKLKLSYNTNEGKLIWEDISGLLVTLQKSGKPLGTFTQSGEITENGIIEGMFQQNNEVRVSSALADLTFRSLSLNAGVHLLDGTFLPTSGGFSLDVENIKGFDQSRLLCKMKYEETNGLFKASTKEARLSAFGITLDKIEKKEGERVIGVTFTPDLTLKSFRGSFSFTHERLNRNHLTVTDFLYEDGRIKRLEMNGNARYQGVKLSIFKSYYDHEKEMIAARLKAEVTESKVEAEAFFYKDGSIEVPDMDFELDLPAFGPIEARLHGGYSMSDVEELDDAYIRYENIGLDFTLKAGNEDVEIIKSSASFELHRETNEYRNVVIDLKLESPPEKGITLAEIEMSANEIHLEVNEKGELSGHVIFTGEVTQPIDLIHEKLKLIKGEGRFRYLFDGKKSFEGHLALEEMENIQVVYLKNDGAFGPQPLLLLSDGTANRDRLTGTFTLPESAGGSYSSNGFEIKLKQISASVSITNYQAFLGAETSNEPPEIRFISGNGEVEVSGIRGLEGELSGEIAIENDSIKVNFGSTKSLAVNGLELDSIRLNATFNHEFDLLNISGGMRAKHEQLKSKLKVTHFVVKNGSLEVMRLKGRSQLKGVEIYVKDAFYHKEKNVIELSAGIKFPVKPHQDYDEMSEIGVKDFIMNFEGTIEQLGFYADIDADPLELKIDGFYKANDYQIKFSTIVFDAEVKGEVALGSRYSSKYGVYYNYFYLQGSGDGNGNGIPLGPTGIMLSRLGGEFGYNYNVDLIKKIKSPQYLTYTAGAELGISIAKTLQVDGRANLTISPEKLQMALGATLEIPPSSDPYIRAMGDIAYEIDYSSKPYKETVKGTLNTRVRIPKESGNIFKMDSEVELNIADDQWKISSNKAFDGKIFNEIDFNGQLELEGDTEKSESFSGNLEGRIYYQWGFIFNKSVLGEFAQVTGLVNTEFYGEINSDFDDQGINSSINSCLKGEASVKAKSVWGGDLFSGTLKILGNGSYSGTKSLIEFAGSIELSSEEEKKFSGNGYFAYSFGNSSIEWQNQTNIRQDQKCIK